jgi:ubiquinone/menaquinone biosynthesis C-methylase UbiE
MGAMRNSDSKSLSQKRFDQFSPGYVISQTHAKGAELDRLVEVARPGPDWVMLDVATGGGHTALKFAPRVARVVAADLTPSMLEAAQAFLADNAIANVIFERADAEVLPFEAGTFDLVTCRIAPHHFPDCPQFVRECARVLKAGGLLLVQDHVLPEDEGRARFLDAFEKLRDPSHNRAFSETQWVSMFQAAGLEVVHIEQIVKRHRFISWAELQGCTPEVVQRLVDIVEDAPEAIAEWMQPRDFGTAQATFVNRHIIIAGRKG